MLQCKLNIGKLLVPPKRQNSGSPSGDTAVGRSEIKKSPNLGSGGGAAKADEAVQRILLLALGRTLVLYYVTLIDAIK